MTDSNSATHRTYEFSPTVAINFEVHGSGSRPMLLVHGFGASLETWRDIQPLLAQDFRLYLVDLKGAGLSSKPNDSAYSPSDQAKIIESFVERYDLKNLVLAGHSYGGAVAMMAYLALHDRGRTGRVSSLVLLDSAGYLQPFPFFVTTLRVPPYRWFALNLLPLHFRVRYTLRQIFYDALTVTPERVERYARFLRLPGAKAALTASAKQIVPPEPLSFIRRIPEIRVPTLILWGQYDPVIPLASAERLHREISNSRLVVIPRCGHVPHEERPAEAVKAVLEFM